MITDTQSLHASFERLMLLRSKLFEAIQKILAEDGHCKSYEGTFEIVMPSYFKQQNYLCDGDAWAINLHCYVIGPGRHYSWSGATLEEAISKAEQEITQWISEVE